METLFGTSTDSTYCRKTLTVGLACCVFLLFLVCYSASNNLPQSILRSYYRHKEKHTRKDILLSSTTVVNLSEYESHTNLETSSQSASLLLKNTGHCQNLHYADHILPFTYLASFPGSGNTWVRHLLQQASGEIFKIIYLYTAAAVCKQVSYNESNIVDGSVLQCQQIT